MSEGWRSIIYRSANGRLTPTSCLCCQAQDLSVIEEVIRMMLEIINSCLCNSLHHNPNLVYALLYKRELFEQFRSHPSFQDIMQNLDTVSTCIYTHTLPSEHVYSIKPEVLL